MQQRNLLRITESDVQYPQQHYRQGQKWNKLVRVKPTTAYNYYRSWPDAKPCRAARPFYGWNPENFTHFAIPFQTTKKTKTKIYDQMERYTGQHEGTIGW